MNIKQLINLTFLVMIYSPGQSATFCVTSSSELQSALTSAQNNSQHDVIKIKSGFYETSNIEFSYVEFDGFDLNISGGWSGLFINSCDEQLPTNFGSTVLDGNSETRVLRIQTAQTAIIEISNLTFINGFAFNSPGSPRGGGLNLLGSEGYAGNITVENSGFINNQAEFGGAVLQSGGYTVTFRNNWFVANHSTVGNSVSLSQNDANGIYFTNNTVYSNSTDTVNFGGGVSVSTSGTSKSLLANNLLWDNDNHDLFLGGDGDHHLKYNDIGSSQGVIPVLEIGNFSLPPRFDSGLLNFTPSAISPLVNGGNIPCTICPNPIPFDQFWTTGGFDAAGKFRTQQGRIDIGAYESVYSPDLIFMNPF